MGDCLVTRRLFPLHRGGGFGGDVVDHPVDVADFIGDAARDLGQQVIGNPCPVGGHKIVGGDSTDGQQMVIGPVVAHDAHGADPGQDAEELGHVLFIAVLRHLVPEDPVGFLEDFHLFRGDLADDPHPQAGAGEGLTPHQLPGDAQLLPYPAHLVLEQVLQRLDGAQEVHILGLLDHIVVGFDLVRLALAGFNAVGVDGALSEEAVGASLAANLIPEGLIELGSDDLPLFLRVGDALEAGQKMLLAVQPDELHVKQPGEGFLHEVPLVLAHQALVHEDAGELVPHGPGDQARRHRGIHAAGQAQDDLLVADLRPEGCHRILDEGIHPPGTGAAADVIQEIAEDLLAVFAVGDLRVELDGVELLFPVFHSRHRADLGMGGDVESRGHLFDPVRVAHPHHALGGHPFQQQRILNIQQQVDFAVFAGFGADDLSAAHPGGELGAVADAEDGDPQLQHLGVVVGGGHIIHAVGAAGEDDAAVALPGDLLHSDAVVGLDLGVDVEVTGPAGNQLIILAAEVQNKNFFHGFPSFTQDTKTGNAEAFPLYFTG